MKLLKFLKKLFNYNVNYKVASHIDKDGKLIIKGRLCYQRANRQGGYEPIKSNCIVGNSAEKSDIMLNRKQNIQKEDNAPLEIPEGEYKDIEDYKFSHAIWNSRKLCILRGDIYMAKRGSEEYYRLLALHDQLIAKTMTD